MLSTYLRLSDQDGKAFTQVKWLLETSTCLTLGWRRVAVHVAIIITANALGALLLGCTLLLGGARLVAAARRATSSHAVLLSLQLGGQLGVGVLHRRRSLRLLPCRLGSCRCVGIIGIVVAIRGRALVRRWFGDGRAIISVGTGYSVKTCFYQLFDRILLVVSITVDAISRVAWAVPSSR